MMAGENLNVMSNISPHFQSLLQRIIWFVVFLTVQTQAVDISLSSKNCGIFGYPSHSIMGAEYYMTPVTQQVQAGDALLVQVVSSSAQYGTQHFGAEGFSILRSSLAYALSPANSVVYSPLEERALAKKEFVDIQNLSSQIPNFGALIGAFVTQAENQRAEFRSFNNKKTAVGIPVGNLEYFGTEKIFFADEPGKLYLGFNHMGVGATFSGAMTISITPVNGVRFELDSESLYEGENLSGVLAVKNDVAIDTIFAITLGGEVVQQVTIPTGSNSQYFSIPIADDDNIQMHRSTLISGVAAGYHVEKKSITIKDNDWSGLDEDGDQMSDIWQRQHLIDSHTQLQDPDGDGYCNFEEDKWGTDPKNKSSTPSMRLQKIGNQISLFMDSANGVKYQILGSSDLVNFSPVSGYEVGDGTSKVHTFNANGNGKYFFGRKALPSEDLDEDGLNLAEESALGTNPDWPDSDGDGVDDGQEVAKKDNAAGSLSPWEDFGGAPPGGQTPTNPLSPDSDSNGISDAYEYTILTKGSVFTKTKYGREPFIVPNTGPIPIYRRETRSWSEVSQVVDIATNPPCIPTYSWGSGSFSFIVNDDGFETYEHTGGDVFETFAAGYTPDSFNRFKPEMWACKSRPGPGYGQSAVTATESTGLISIQRELSCQHGDPPQTYSPQHVFTIFGPATIALSDEYTTAHNIDVAWQRADPGVNILSSNYPQTSGGYVRLANRELSATVARLKYSVNSPQKGQVSCASVFKAAGSSAIEVTPSSLSGEIPTSQRVGESGLVVLGNPILNSCLPFHPGQGTLYIGGNLAVQFEVPISIIGTAIESSIIPNLTGHCGSAGGVSITSGSSGNKISVNVQLIQVLTSSQSLVIKLAGVDFWQITLDPDLPADLIDAVFVTPKDRSKGGDPVNFPEDNPDVAGTNEFTYSASETGKLMIRLSATASCVNLLNVNDLIFEVEDISGSQKIWKDGHEGGKAMKLGSEVYAIVTFVGLPVNNSSFGGKIAKLKYQGTVIAEAEYEVFFKRDSKNNPSTERYQVEGKNYTIKAPNWYYYWKQAYPSPYSMEYGGEGNGSAAEVKAMSKWDYTIPRNKQLITIYDPAKLRFSAYGVGDIYSGIDSFINTILHESKHVQQIALADALIVSEGEDSFRYGWSWNQPAHNNWNKGLDGEWGQQGIDDDLNGIVDDAAASPPFELGSGDDESLAHPYWNWWPKSWPLPVPNHGLHPIESDAVNFSDANHDENKNARDDWGNPGKNHQTIDNYAD